MMRSRFEFALAAVLALATSAAAQAPPPHWIHGPEPKDFTAAYPSRAEDRGQSGRAVIKCDVNIEGRLEACEVIKESPAGFGLGGAALKVAKDFQMTPLIGKDGKPGRGSVQIPLVFTMDGSSPPSTPPVTVSSPQPPVATAGSHTITNPDWLKKPNIDAYEAVWPSKALENGTGGSATIRCEISEQGLLEGCEVVAENPPGQGFAAAALLLAPRFLLRPGTVDGKPVRSSITIPIRWGMPGGTPPHPNDPPPPLDKPIVDRTVTHTADAASREIKMIPNPLWLAAPTHAEVEAVWPKGVRAGVDYGHVTMTCHLTAKGTLRQCLLLSQDPPGLGFGGSALSLAGRFTAPVGPDDAAQMASLLVSIPFHFIRPGTPDSDTIHRPRWVKVVSSDDLDLLYPAAARAAGLKTGLGVADCAVGPDGVLGDCQPGREDPEGQGFAAAAVKAAMVMQMSPWSDGGRPVDGERIKLPIRFTLPGDAPPEPTTPLPASTPAAKPSSAPLQVPDTPLTPRKPPAPDRIPSFPRETPGRP